jgi:hypothetical protein
MLELRLELQRGRQTSPSKKNNRGRKSISAKSSSASSGLRGSM